MEPYPNGIGVKVPEILLPNPEVDLQKWAVVACDQYTSQPEYWEKTDRIVGEAPSTLRIMLPEIYLDKPDEQERIAGIRSFMGRYLNDGILTNKGKGFVLVKRTVSGKTRTGLIFALDLDQYDYKKGSSTLIRATEGTIVERIPPRLRIREGAPLEMPHIIVLIDDPDKTVIEPAAEKIAECEKLYDFDLMQGGGHIEGYFIDRPPMIQRVLDALAALADPGAFHKKYGDDCAPLLFALGDGNHSFATAKAGWEKIKKDISEEERRDHPARFALVEVENVHDEGIMFEPIHRVLFNIDVKKAEKFLKTYLAENNGGCETMFFKNKCVRSFKRAVKENMHVLSFCSSDGYGFFMVKGPKAQLEVGTLQAALDALLKEYREASIDYIHGSDIVASLGTEPGNMGFFLSPMPKSALFPTVVYDGALPRKTFSMGEAHEKRYYLECRRIL
ncbi:MAG: hypothetical protein BWY11_01263 [Firmicutes bacterium ADurb.Bin182]|nr:MAG: hypothetical protein BWY11_01263 [Firmicutes bacterium ADurb.Bin182]